MAIVQTGSVLTFPALGAGNTGTVSSTITVPADAEFVIVGWSSYSGAAAYFSGGSMTFTKGGVDTAMTYAGGDGGTAAWSGPCFYLNLPDTGANKTLKWDWASTGTAADINTLCSVTFWKGVDTTSPVRATGTGSSGTSTPYTTGSTAGSSGDLAVAWVGAFSTAEGTAASWSNLTLLSQITRSGAADGAWATGSPSAAQTYACSTDTNWDDGSITVIVLKPAAGGGVSASITGVAATSAAGTPTVTGFGNVTLTGASSTAAAGTATVSAKANATLTGVAATPAVNAPTITAAANVFPTGAVGTTAVNIPTVSGFANVSLSGVAATGQAGDVTVTVGGAVSVNLTGVSATSAAGTPTITGLANVSVTGVSATAQIGTLTTSAAANASLTGVAATSAAGTQTVTGLANVSLTGANATAQAGDVTVSVPTGISITLDGVQAGAFVGSVTTNLDQPNTDGQTVLTNRGPGGFSRRQYEELIQAERAERAALDKARLLKKKAGEELRKAAELTEKVTAKAGLLGDIAPSIEPLTEALDDAVHAKATQTVELAREAIQIARELLAQMEDEEREVEYILRMLLTS